LTERSRREHATSHEVVVVGTGFAGLGMAIKLREAGIEDFVVLEQARRRIGHARESRGVAPAAAGYLARREARTRRS
jgi:cation diffusion facilitator CzcD-associated flavoprotein CzcO